MKPRFSLADKISITIITVGIFGILLVFYISSSYRDFAYQHHADSIRQIADLKIEDLVEDLRGNSLDLAQTIEREDEFREDFLRRDKERLGHLLDNQFHQYFVTAGVLRLLKLYILDTGFNLVSQSSEGMETDDTGSLACPRLSRHASSRRGADKLQTISRSCLYRGHPVYAVMVPFGGLRPEGYIQVVTDLSYNLKNLETSLAMPSRIMKVDDEVIHVSRAWETTEGDHNYLPVDVTVSDDDGKEILHISLKSNMSSFNKEIYEHRNWILALAFVTTALTIFIILFILQRSAIPPLAKIHDVLEKIHLDSHDDKPGSRVLFEQLLEQIISLRRKSRSGFSVMIIDLIHFGEINDKYGQSTGDEILRQVEERLGTFLRGSDLISWVGTDTPGHKLAPSGTTTQYRATIARLGGDEFGLLLPTAANEEQASAVAHRIVEGITRPFEVKRDRISISCRIGVSIYPQHGKDEKQLIRNADKAMYAAKSGNLAVAIYSP